MGVYKLVKSRMSAITHLVFNCTISPLFVEKLVFVFCTMRWTIAATALSLGTLGDAELLHERFHRMGRSPNSTSTTIPSPPKPSNSSIPLHPHNSTGCLSLQNLNQADWKQSNTGTWLDNWWTANSAAISQNGFLNTFAELALNDPGWTCPIDGTCQVPCIPVKQTGVQGNLLARADPLASSTQTGYVANSLSNLQTQFNTLYSILNSAGTKTSLDINSLVQNFWYDGSEDSTMDLSEGLRSFGLILGLGAAIATGGAVMPAAVASALFSNVVTLVFGGLPSP